MSDIGALASILSVPCLSSSQVLCQMQRETWSCGFLQKWLSKMIKLPFGHLGRVRLTQDDSHGVPGDEEFLVGWDGVGEQL
jgi:hypothetical protein